MDAILSSHCGSRLIRPAELEQLPAPLPLGPHHRPVPHHELVGILKEELEEAGYQVAREEYAVQNQGLKLFGVMDLVPAPGTSSALSNGDKGLGLGFRHGNDQSMSLRLVAGARVFVRDNLVLSGDMIVMRRKHTTGLSLKDEIRAGVERLTQKYAALEQGILRLKERGLSDPEAKTIIYDAFVREGVLPMRFLPQVGTWYFEPPAEAEDCRSRSAWGLHNAFTRTVKELSSPARRFEATTRIGKVFGLRSRAGEIEK
ncbi:MAG: hypothetical protein HY760_09180 [Nitrospirae bacterium]|nr:hypothetical protein [Nitrospirota bacterium]